MNLPKNLTFIDIETTGGSIIGDRIVEIGLLKVIDNKLETTYQTFLNPDRYFPPEIQMLTGINPADLENAPSFFDIKDELLPYFEDSVFVAHNARFDYGFLKQEFLRYGIKFNPKQLCTVKLSRLLFPEFRHHNLDSIIERFNFKIENRHRAFDDAKILWNFYQKIQKSFPEERLTETIGHILKKPNTPPGLKNFELSTLPETPGVYIFYGKSGIPLYVGKSKNLKERIFNHFAMSSGSPIEMKIYNQIESLEIIKTEGELGALLKESETIKKLLPLYNRMLRHKEKMVFARSVKEDGIFTIKLEETESISPDELESVMAVYKTKRAAREALVAIAKDFQLCDRFLGLEKTKSGCFSSRLGKCLGICEGRENALKYNLRFIEAFVNSKIKSWPHNGPVIIKEGNEGFLIDKWCFLGKVDEENQPSGPFEYSFDLDYYKIFKRFLYQQAAKPLEDRRNNF